MQTICTYGIALEIYTKNVQKGWHGWTKSKKEEANRDRFNSLQSDVTFIRGQNQTNPDRFHTKTNTNKQKDNKKNNSNNNNNPLRVLWTVWKSTS